MKLLTLNTHSLIEDDYNNKLTTFTKAIVQEKPDIIALQEVNQTSSAPMSEIGLKSDNHLLTVYKRLCDCGLNYHIRWLSIKKSYEKYDEGIALMSLKPISETDGFTFSKTKDFYNWKMRKALGAKVDDKWFYSLHTSWWDDEDEPFKDQWQVIASHMKNRKNVYLMGDFNAPVTLRNQSYDLITSSGWKDTFSLAERKDKGYTIPGKIDGWNNKSVSNYGERIDYIFTNSEEPILSSQVIFNGKNYDRVSDHFGVMIEIE